MSDNLKGDFVNSAYGKARISGLTAPPTKEDDQLGLEIMEDMMEEYFGRNINVNYMFEDDPDPNTPHNVDRKFWNSIKACLSGRLLANFGKEPMQSLANQIKAGLSFLSSATAPIRETQYPSRQPVGSGNTSKWYRWDRFYRPVGEVPLSAESIRMAMGDVDTFTEHFDSWLVDPETVASYVLTSDDGLTVSSDSLTTPDITYTVTATGTSSEGSDSILRVIIVATSSTGRITTRQINFELIEVEI